METFVDNEMYEPTPAELRMAENIKYLLDAMLNGEIAGIAIAAIDPDGRHQCSYYNKSQQGVLRGPIDELRVMYETNQSFRALDTAPPTNKSYRSH